MNEKIPVLAVRQPCAGFIASGKKTILINDYPTPSEFIGHKIAIYASNLEPYIECPYVGYRPSRLGVLPPKPLTCFFKGVIIALATLEESHQCVSLLDFNSQQKAHWIPRDNFLKNKTYYWSLKDIQLLSSPFSFSFRGSSDWSNIDLKRLERAFKGLL